MSIAYDMNQAVWWLRTNDPDRLMEFSPRFTSIKQLIKSMSTGESDSVLLNKDWNFDVMGFFEDDDEEGMGVALVTFHENDIKYLTTTLKGAIETFEGMRELIDYCLKFDEGVEAEIAMAEEVGGAPWA